jgi:hypothetical protein
MTAFSILSLAMRVFASTSGVSPSENIDNFNNPPTSYSHIGTSIALALLHFSQSFNLSLALVSIFSFLSKDLISFPHEYPSILISYSFSFSAAKLIISFSTFFLNFLKTKELLGILFRDFLISLIVFIILYLFTFHFVFASNSFIINYNLNRDIGIIILLNFIISFSCKNEFLLFGGCFGMKDNILNLFIFKCLESLIYHVLTKSTCIFIFRTVLKVFHYKVEW